MTWKGKDESFLDKKIYKKLKKNTILQKCDGVCKKTYVYPDFTSSNIKLHLTNDQWKKVIKNSNTLVDEQGFFPWVFIGAASCLSFILMNKIISFFLFESQKHVYPVLCFGFILKLLAEQKKSNNRTLPLFKKKRIMLLWM